MKLSALAFPIILRLFLWRNKRFLQATHSAIPHMYYAILQKIYENKYH